MSTTGRDGTASQNNNTVRDRAVAGGGTAKHLTEHWQERAQCRGMDTEIFFTFGSREKLVRARQICNHCPVQLECLLEGLELDEHFRDQTGSSKEFIKGHGIRGGKTPEERAYLRRELEKRKK